MTRTGTTSTTARLAVVIGALSALLLLAACSGNDAADADVDMRDGVVIGEDKPRPSFVLTDTAGNEFDFEAETDGYLTLLYFGYTNCPDVCPIHFANIAGGLDQVPIEVRNRVKVVFVGVDPPRDSPERIRQWLDHFSASFIGLTGTDEELLEAQIAAGVPPSVREEPDENGRYAVGHAGWVIGYTPGDEETWQFPLGIRQQRWAEVFEELAAVGAES